MEDLKTGRRPQVKVSHNLRFDADRVKQDFLKLASKFTGGEMTDEVLKKAAEKISKRPRTAETEVTEN